VIKIRKRVIIERVICIARVRTASRSANGNELTLARERQAKQNFALCGLRHFVPGLALATGILRDWPVWLD
jgi:hypothetical protein